MQRKNRSSGWLRTFFWICATPFLWGLATVAVSQMALSQSGAYPLSTKQQQNILEKPYKADEVLVKFKPYTAQSTANTVMNTLQVHPVKHYRKVDVHLTKTPPGKSVEETVRQFKENPSVEYAEPNYIWYADEIIPDDPDFGLLWGLNNTGQSGGTTDADIDAPEAWEIQTGSGDLVIAVIDTGVDYEHIDLIDNMWVNTGETPGDGIDNDNNGYIDDVHGINAITESGDPMDDQYHGTHCAGTIAGQGNNALGITGVSWSSKIMALKFLGESGSGCTCDAIECIEYMVDMKSTYGVNVKVSSNSWGGGGYSIALEDAIRLAQASDILFIAAAGNSTNNNDFVPHYPASYDCFNIVSVAASDHNDEFASFSCYGYNTVDVAAPGVNIWSTQPGHSYQYLGGTSMATPHVAGLAALIYSHYPGVSYFEVKERLLRTVDTKSYFTDTLASGGRINAYAALTADLQGPFIYSLSPPASGYDTELIIEGSQFGENQGAGYVTFFENLTASIVSWSDHQIVCTVPPGCQSGPVIVTTDESLQSNEKFFILAGSISGFVSKEISGDPLIMTELDIYDSDGNFISYTFPNMEGHYIANGLPPGSYYAFANNYQGYVDAWYQDADPEEGDPPPIYVESNQETANIDFVLAAGASITGRVTRDPTGEPIEDVLITLYDNSGDWTEQFTWSKSEGHYTIDGLPTGDYYVETQNRQGYIDEWYQDANPSEGDPPPIHLDAPDRTDSINFALVLGGTISGRVTRDPTGEPLSNITILVVDRTGYTISAARSDLDGYYRVNGVHTGDFYVETMNDQGYLDEWFQDAVFRDGDPPPVHVEAPNETSNINFALQLGGAIAGQVTANVTGEPLSGIYMFAYDSNRDSHYSWTDAEGHYTINSLPTGDYYLQTGNDQGFVDQWYQGADPDEGDPPPVHVDAPNLTPNINFTMTPGGTISGIIRDCDDPSITIADATACAYEWETGDFVECSNLTDSTGSYHITGLPDGSYQVWVSQYNGSYIRKCTEYPIELVVEDGYTLDLCMEVGGSISGTISCENCSGGLISVWALSEPESDLSTKGGNYIGHDLIFTPGPYTLEGLPYDTEMWIYAEWRQSVFIPGNYYGAYAGNPLTLTEGGPYPTDVDIYIQNMGCIADYDCDGICDPGESAPNCSGFDECPYDPENDIDGDSICGDNDNCPNHHNPSQEDTFPPEGNGIGDACECEGDFDCDMDQDGSDAAQFKQDFGRSSFYDPCAEGSSCNGDFDSDQDVDGMDAYKFKEDFGRCAYHDPCPVCVIEE